MMPLVILATRRAQVNPRDVMTVSPAAMVTGAKVKPGEVSKVLPMDWATRVITESHSIASPVSHEDDRSLL
jgi:hypothetical protein